VRLAEERGVGLAELDPAALRDVDSRIGEGALLVLGVDDSVRSRTSYGGTAPERVREQIAAAKKAIGLD
jgi:argininosuccinate lyase